MAGGFGNYIDPESAKRLGLYPEIGPEGVTFLGNAAGYGAMYGLLYVRADGYETDAPSGPSRQGLAGHRGVTAGCGAFTSEADKGRV